MMCALCAALSRATAQTGSVSHLTHPRDRLRIGEFDVYGFARCSNADCMTLWYLDPSQQLTAVGIKGDRLFPRRPAKRLQL